jgi:hypothetical protein
MRLILATSSLALAFVVGCSFAYKSMYKETNHSLHPKPVAAADVKVVKSKDDLTSSFTELGSYKGHAPTVKEAMDAAKQECGAHGADLYILATEPFQSENVWKVEGVCAVKS